MSAAASRGLRLAIVGATGTVGARLVELIDERRFPFAELKLFASADSSAQSVEGSGREYPVSELRDPAELRDFDVVFLAAPEQSAVEIIKAVAGPVLIDLSRAAYARSQAPLVAPGLTARETIRQLAIGRVLAVPHPAAYALATILKALELRAEFVSATVILGASAGGRETITRLIEQSAELMNAQLDVAEGETQLAFNVFVDRQARAEEIAAQAAALLNHAPCLTLQVAQAPTLHGTALALAFPGQGPRVRARLREAPGVLLIDDEAPEFRGVVDAVGEDAVLVRAFEQAAGIALWCLFDSARLAALSALWVAENLLPEHVSTLA